MTSSHNCYNRVDIYNVPGLQSHNEVGSADEERATSQGQRGKQRGWHKNRQKNEKEEVGVLLIITENLSNWMKSSQKKKG